MSIKFFLGLLISLLVTSCVTQVLRPKLTGTIVDEQGKPLVSCLVGDAYTDKNGNYELPEITAVRLFSFFGGSPIFLGEPVHKEGYEPKELVGGNRRGGVSLGTVWHMDTIRLRKTLTDFTKVTVQDHWLASMTKNLDTVFMTKKDLMYDRTKIDVIANNCDTYAKGYYYLGIDNLPKNVFERHIALDLTDSILDIQRVLIYADVKTSEKTKYDTIYTQGKWKQEHKTLFFETELPELNGTYKVVNFNYDSMELIKQ
ncbi:hypothetical protein [Cellulophaga sp. Asnod2-G02]|uniref:hypothetical protein n=1 Tax=Cellulophaga sp. Asnod2-G02 TaxID=3160572 RepID=UPI003870C6BA